VLQLRNLISFLNSNQCFAMIYLIYYLCLLIFNVKNMNILDDFGKFARSKRGVSSTGLHKYTSVFSDSYISPTILRSDN